MKRAADELLVARLASVTLGERIALARRCSGLVASALLLDKEPPVWQAALENPRLTEAAIVRALQRPQAAAVLVEAICHHAKWSLRLEIRMALLRNEKTPLARALEFARRLHAGTTARRAAQLAAAGEGEGLFAEGPGNETVGLRYGGTPHDVAQVLRGKKRRSG